ncbi:MAG: rhodanese-like domain-containing protein [Gammaproteobacteria bacterium]
MEFIDFLGDQWLLVATLLLFAAMLVWTESAKRALSLGVGDAVQWINRHQALVIDLRSKEDCQKGHIAGSVNFELADASEASRIALREFLNKRKITTESRLLLVCDSGQKSRQIGSQLKKEGYTQAASLARGVNGWGMDGLPLVSNKSPSKPSNK